MKKNTGINFLTVLLLLIFIVKSAVFFFYIHAGIDIGDEGQLVMGFRHPQEYTTFPYYQFVSPFLGNFLSDIVFSRAVKFFLEIVFISLISTTVYLWFTYQRPDFKGKKTYVHIWLAASLSNCTFVFARVTTYDDFIGLFPALSLLFIAMAFFRNLKTNILLTVLFALSGLFLGFVFFIKATVLPLMLGCFSLLTAFYFYRENAKILIACGALYSGTVAGLVTGIFMCGGWAVICKDFTTVAHISSISAYNLNFLLTNYWHRDVPYLLLIFVSAALHFWWLTPNPGLLRWLYLVVVNVIFTGWLLYRDINFAPVAYLHSFMFLLLSSSVGFLMILKPKKEERNTAFTFIFILFLFLLPFLLAVGTANSIFENSSLYFAVYYAIAFIALTYYLPIQFRGLFYGYIIFSGAYFFHTQVLHPYGLPTPIFQQNEQALAFDKRLSTDKKSADFLNQIYEVLAAHGFIKGDDILATEGLTGLASIVGGRMPVTLQILPDNFALNCYYIQQITTGAKKPYLIVSRKIQEQFQDCLSISSLKFPQSYELATVILNPYKGAFKIHYGGQLDDSVYIFVPVK